MSYRDDDDPFEEDIVFDQAGLLSTSRKPSKSAIRRVSSGKCATLSKTLGLCGAFLGLGLTVAIPGPLSPFPPSVLSHDISLMTYEVMYRCQGFMIGAMFGARLLDRFNRLFLVFLALLVTALLVTIIPWCGIIWLLRTDMFLLGVSFGFLTTGGNVLCLDLWGRNSGPFMQALHFSFSLGVFLAPLLSQPLMASVNYPLPAPSATPAMFPLHRLPRDVSLTSAANANTTVVKQHLVSINGSFEAASVRGLNSSTPLDLGQILSLQPPLSSNASSTQTGTSQTHMANATVQSVTVGISTMQTTTSDLSSATLLNHTSTNSTVPTLLSHLPSDSSEISGAANVSTTTHRAPRPKPILTNSEKLKDKMWENEKFRKPPPQDLVPVSTTMKPMAQHYNKTTSGNSISVTTMSTVIPKRNLTSEETNGASAMTKSNSSLLPLNVDSSTLKTSKNLTGNLPHMSTLPSPQNISVISTSTAVPVMPKVTSSMITSGLLSDKQKTSFVVATTSEPLKTNFSLQVNDSSNYALKPNDEGKTTANLLTADHKKGDVAVPSSSPISDVLIGSKMRSEELSYKTEAVQSASVSSSSFNEGEIQPQSDLLLPLLENTRSKNTLDRSGESALVDKSQLSAFNPSTTPSSVRTSELQAKRVEVPSPSSQTMVKPVSTEPAKDIIMNHTYPVYKFSGRDQLEKTTDNKQSYPEKHKIFDDKKVSTVVSVGKPEDSSPLNIRPHNDTTSLLKPASVGSSASPKHTHHSKPASTVVNDTEVTHTVIDAFANRLEKYGLSRMELMYLTVGMVLLATSLLFLGFLCFNPRDPKSKTDDEEINGSITRANHQSRNNTSSQMSVITSRCMRHTLIGLMMMLLMITSGVQAMYGQLLLVYAIQSPLQIPQSTGTALTATFWGALTSTRFACILLASALSPTAMLILSLSICSCATWLLSAFSSSSEVALWIGSVMVSVGTASVFPSGLLWMQHHVLITHRVAAMLVMGPAMGEMFFPPLAYKMMVSLGPASLVHLPALLSLFAIALWAAVWRLARYPRPPLCSNADDSMGYQLASQNDEDDLVDLTMSPIVNGNGALSRNLVRSNGMSHRMPYITT